MSTVMRRQSGLFNSDYGRQRILDRLTQQRKKGHRPVDLTAHHEERGWLNWLVIFLPLLIVLFLFGLAYYRLGL